MVKGSDSVLEKVSRAVPTELHRDQVSPSTEYLNSTRTLLGFTLDAPFELSEAVRSHPLYLVTPIKGLSHVNIL